MTSTSSGPGLPASGPGPDDFIYVRTPNVTGSAHLPSIIVNDGQPLRFVTDQCLAAIADANEPEPFIFRFGASVVRIRADLDDVFMEALDKEITKNARAPWKKS